jgi:ankyrin repeat protein
MHWVVFKIFLKILQCKIIFKAAYKGYSELVSLLLYFGLNPQRQDNFGQTALHLACINGNLQTVKVLADLVRF